MTLLTLILYSMNMISVSVKGADGGDLFHPYCPPTPPSQGSPFNQLAARQTSCKCNLYIYISISLSSRLPGAHWCLRSINLTSVVKTPKWALHHCGACLLEALQPSVQNKAQMSLSWRDEGFWSSKTIWQSSEPTQKKQNPLQPAR